MPTAVGSVAAALLVVTVWTTGGLWQGPEHGGTAMAAFGQERASSPSPTTSRSTTSRKPTKKSTTPPPPPTTTTTTEQPVEKPEPEPTTPPPPPLEECSTELEGTQSHVAQVGNHVLNEFDVDSVGGQASRSGSSDHPEGLALDFMVDEESGDAIAEYVLDHQAEFGVTYVIWQQQYNDGDGWSTMEDRGGATANHYDHVHVSFESSAAVSVTC